MSPSARSGNQVAILGVWERHDEGTCAVVARCLRFPDDGWRLKTDAAEQPDPAQSDRLAPVTSSALFNSVKVAAIHATGDGMPS